jgi:hypothetical protein
MRVRCVMGALALASVVLLGAVGSARAADKWMVLGKQTLNSTSTSAEIKGEKGKLFKEDVKATKLSVEGADVEISKVILHWNNRPDVTIMNVGVIKSGEQTNPKDSPGREATLKSVTVQYKILNNAPTATVTLWGMD